jgi:phosphocarrier protein
MPMTMETEQALISNDTATRRVFLTNIHGLHFRPAMVLSEHAQSYPCVIRVSCGERQADAKSILDLLTLAAVFGSELVFEAQGPHNTEAVDCPTTGSHWKKGCCAMTAATNKTTRLAAPQHNTHFVMSAAGAPLLHDIIAKRAYAIWQSHGCPVGTARNDWFQAQAEVKGEIQRARRSQPAAS